MTDAATSIPRVLVLAAMALLFILPAPAARGDEKSAVVPLASIVLFTSGVGYFQHDGTVDGDSRMELEFATSGINDILKSMILRDLDGGAVSGVTYASRDPVTKTLKSFAVDLTGAPGIAAILTQVRGRQVEVSAPEVVQGTILGVERRIQTTREGGEMESYLLNLSGPQGIRTLDLSQVQSIRFLDREVQNDLAAALALIGSAKDLDKKKVVLHFTGKGRRRVRVGYIQESPVWKTSYRLAVAEDKTTFLQGWAVVENTSDSDWKDVGLTLVSGRPITFIMDLYTPLYVQRPVVQPELYSSLAPRTYDMAMSPEPPEAMDEEDAPMTKSMAKERAAPAPAPRAAAPSMAAGAAAPPRPEPFALSQGVTQAARAGQVGELFQYAIEKPVSLPRQQSALLPIVNQNIGGDKYSIYNEGVDPAHPLNALKLKNSSSVHLMRGPVTVFDGGIYAGDAQLGDFPPGAEQFISYAMDLDTEVAPQAGPAPQNLFSVRISKGIVTTTYKLSRERDYAVKNRGGRAKAVVIEHPLDASWNLVQPKEVMEKARGVYRLLLPVEAGGSKTLAVIEERMVDQTVSVSSLGSDTVAFFVRSSTVSAAVKEALQKLQALKVKAGDASSARARVETQIQDIYREQSRIRDNISRLEKGSTLYNRYVKTLSDQEDQLAQLNDSLARARAEEQARQKDVETYIMTMEVK
jgi:hypothetical protein